MSELPRRLVELGSVLNLRFELEDQLIQAVHASHEALVA
jgi:regulator of sigma D